MSGEIIGDLLDNFELGVDILICIKVVSAIGIVDGASFEVVTALYVALEPINVLLDGTESDKRWLDCGGLPDERWLGDST